MAIPFEQHKYKVLKLVAHQLQELADGYMIKDMPDNVFGELLDIEHLANDAYVNRTFNPEAAKADAKDCAALIKTVLDALFERV